MVQAQRDRIKMMISDDAKINGIDELLLLQTYINNLIKSTIKEELNEYNPAGITDLDAIELFVDVPFVFYDKINKMIEYLKETYKKEKIYASDLLYLDYNFLLAHKIIDLNALIIIRHRLISLRDNQIVIVEDPQKQKKYVIPND